MAEQGHWETHTQDLQEERLCLVKVIKIPLIIILQFSADLH